MLIFVVSEVKLGHFLPLKLDYKWKEPGLVPSSILIYVSHLFCNSHLLDQVIGVGDLVDDEENISDVE